MIPGGGDNVAGGIKAHAVDAAMHAARVFAPGEERVVGTERAIVFDRVGAQLARDAALRAAFGDIQGALVLRHEDAVGLGGVEGYARDLVAAVFLRAGAQHGAVIEFFFFGFVPVAVVDRVGEPDAALPVNRQIVGGAEFFAVESVGDDDILSVRIKAHNRAPARAATKQAPVGVERQAVGAIGVAAPFVDSVRCRVVTHDAVLAYLREVNVLAVPHRAFGDELFGAGLQQQFKIPGHR